MKKTFMLLLVFCFLTCLCLGAACKGKKKEARTPTTPEAQEREQGTFQAKKVEKKKLPFPVPPNNAPKIVEAHIVPDPAYANSDLRVEVEAEDAEGDLIELKYQWIKFEGDGPARRAVNIEEETTATLSRDKFAHGDVVAARVTPVDWNGTEGEPYQTRLLVIKNSPPEIISSPPVNLSKGNVYTYQVKVKDLDNDPITFSLSEDAPKGMTIDPVTGIITWIIAPGTSGSFTARVNGNDGNGGTCYQRLNLSVPEPAKPPEEGKE